LRTFRLQNLTIPNDKSIAAKIAQLRQARISIRFRAGLGSRSPRSKGNRPTNQYRLAFNRRISAIASINGRSLGAGVATIANMNRRSSA
jgi:hypothetical protein